MNAWSNVEISQEDPEIRRIDAMENVLHQLDPDVRRVRELITRFEICHFKYRQHIGRIKASIINLHPTVIPDSIGVTHLRAGEDAALRDGTGRSALALKYIRALRGWLNHDAPGSREQGEEQIHDQVDEWLGEKEPDKERLVRLLTARMKWDWESYEKLNQGERHRELALQCCKMDTCHYRFPENLDLLLRAIGELRPAKNFEGCGSFTPDIRDLIKREFNDLNTLYRSVSARGSPGKADPARAWLLACMLKTMKEQAGLNMPIAFK